MSDNANEDPVELNASFESIGGTTDSFRNLLEQTSDFESTRNIGSVTNSFRVSSSNDQNLLCNADNSILTATTNSFQNVEPSNSLDSTNNSNLYQVHLNQFNEEIETCNLEDSLFSSNIDDEIYNSSEEDEDYYEGLDNSRNIPQQFTRLIQMLQVDDTNETIDANFVVNKAEILLAILKFASQYGLSNSATADLCKMLNTFVNTPFLPDTRYMMDKLFYSGEGIQYHAVCPTCKTYIDE